ncbi:hypothetical protein [Chitinophaga sp.]|uniref:hypothetical protein n=1 Tax=Chitinophaga sp. TaxID=1869181 RepID=UPI002F941EFC
MMAYTNYLCRQLFTVAFLAMFTGLLQPVSAQDQPEAPAQKKVSLGKAAPLTADSQQAKISGITVLSAVWDTARIGFLQTGLFNNKVEAVPDKEMGSYLQEYVNNTFGGIFVPGKPRLIWVVQDLRIGERTQMMGEKAYVRLKATAYVQTGEDSYKLLKAMDIAHLNGGFDVTHQHRNNISNAFKEFYTTGAAAIDSVLADTQPVLSLAGINAIYAQKRELPALKAPLMSDGVYLSFDSFLQNKPDIPQFETKGKAGKVKVYAVAGDGKQTVVPSLWGIVKNGAVFKYHNKSLVGLSRSGYGYVISSYLSAYERRQTAIIAGAFVGGVAGAALGSTAALQHTDAFPELKLPAEATAIDMETGALIF